MTTDKETTHTTPAMADLDKQSEREAFVNWSQVFHRNARSYTARDFDHGLVAWLARAAQPVAPMAARTLYARQFDLDSMPFSPNHGILLSTEADGEWQVPFVPAVHGQATGEKELPTIDTPEFRERLRGLGATFAPHDVAYKYFVGYVNRHFAVAASRRAAGPFAAVDCPECGMGSEHDPACPRATPAPASAGQAAPASMPSLQYNANKVREQMQKAIAAQPAEGILTPEQMDRLDGLETQARALLEKCQPAEGAGQAGQVAACRACKGTGHDGDCGPDGTPVNVPCPACEGTGIAPTERAAAPADSAQPQPEAKGSK